MRIAVLWSRFGPYHLARLRGAAAAAGAYGASVIGLEVAARDRDYDWAEAPGADGFERVTLFPGADYHALSAGAIGRAVAEALGRIRPDIVAVNGWSAPEARAAAAWCRRHGSRAVLMSETKVDDNQRPLWKEMVKRLLLRRYDAALVGGRAQGDYLASLGFPRERIRHGYDVVDNSHFEAGARQARAEAARLRHETGLPERYFLACTRLLARKNIDGLLRAYAQYRQRSVHEPWGLVVLGSGEEAYNLRALAGELGLDDVQWPGFVQYEQLPAYYGLARAFVHPAKSEAWGLVVNEAAASGLPILCSRIVGARYELVREGENGFLFDPFDVEALASALGRMANMQADDRAWMGRRSQAIVGDWWPLRFGRELMEAAGLGERARPVRAA